jgi:hypothetical protein
MFCAESRSFMFEEETLERAIVQMRARPQLELCLGMEV